MAVVNTKSSIITNADASPRTLNESMLAEANLSEAVGTVEVAAADSDGSVYRFVRVKSSWMPSQITLFNDAIAGATVYDCGIYQTAFDGGAAIDADCFATNVDINAGTLTGTELLFEALNIDQIEKRFWEIAEPTLTKDPQRWYDICLTGDTVGTAAGTLSLRVRYRKG